MFEHDPGLIQENSEENKVDQNQLYYNVAGSLNRQIIATGNKEAERTKNFPPVVKKGIKIKNGVQVGDYLKANHTQMKKLKGRLKSNVWNWGPVLKWDSSVMREVNNSLAAIANLMNQDITDGQLTDRPAYKTKVHEIQAAYNRALTAADAYINARAGARTSSGKKRLQMVRSLKDKLQKEKDLLSAAVWQMYDSKQKSAVKENSKWEDALYMARSDQRKLEKVKGGRTASIRKFIDEDGRTKFYKQEEIILPQSKANLGGVSEDEIRKFKRITQQNGKLDVEQLSEEDRERYEWVKVYSKIKALDKNVFGGTQDFFKQIMSYIGEYSKALLQNDEKAAEDAAKSIREFVGTKTEGLKPEDRKMVADTIYSMLLTTPNEVYSHKLFGNFRILTPEEEQKLEQDSRRESEEKNAQVNRRLNGYRQIMGKAYASQIAAGNGIQPGTRISLRNVATTRVEKLLFGNKYDEHPLTARSQTVIQFDGKKYVRGNVMEAAEGVPCTQIRKEMKEKNINSDEDITISPFALQQVSDLMVMDYLVGQMDRHGGNFCVTYKLVSDGKEIGKKLRMVITGVTGIDNDMSFTPYDADKLNKGNGKNRLEDIHNIKCISRDLKERIMELNIDILKYELADLGISGEEFGAMDSRLNELKAYISKPEENHVTICSKEDWADQSLGTIDARKRDPYSRDESKELINSRGVAYMMRSCVMKDHVSDIKVEKPENPVA